MRFTPSEIEEFIANIKDDMKGMDPIDPDYIAHECELDNFYRELEWMEDNLSRLRDEEESYYGTEFLD